jgi:deoxyribose-phosphate aldolase
VIRAPWLGPAAGAPGIGQFIDLTLLTPEATPAEILQLAERAIGAGVAAVCVNSAWVRLAAERVAGTEVAVAATIGFPLGAAATAVKVAEARVAIGAGAGELDMVMALGLAKSGAWEAVADDIRAVVDAAGGTPVKVIVETAALAGDELERAAAAVLAGGAAFVKTSTGFHGAGGATVDAVRRLRAAVGLRAGVKASGGIRTAEQALAMLAAGANRLGTSNLAGLASVIGPSAPPLADLLTR